MSALSKVKGAEAVAEESVKSLAKQFKNPRGLTRFVPNSVSRKVGRATLKVAADSPKILFVGGTVGVVATTVLACRATLQLPDHLEEMRKDLLVVDETENLEKYSEKDQRKMRAYLYARFAGRMAKLYGPTFVLGVTSVGALAGAQHILTKRNVGLTAAYAAVEQGFAQYRERVVDEFGEEKDKELRYGSQEKTIVEEQASGEIKKKTVKRHNTNGTSMYARVFDDVTSRNWQRTPLGNRTFIQLQQNWANDLLKARGHVFLNEVYDLLGLERSAAGQVVGWYLDEDGIGYIDFGIFDRMNTERINMFMTGQENSVLLDFNVDGPIYKKLGK